MLSESCGPGPAAVLAITLTLVALAPTAARAQLQVAPFTDASSMRSPRPCRRHRPAPGSVRQRHPDDGNDQRRVLPDRGRRARLVRDSRQLWRGRGADAGARRPRLAARRADPPDRARPGGIHRRARRCRFEHRRAAVVARGRGGPRRRRAAPEPAGAGRARQPAWLDGRGQRAAARAGRGRRAALRPGRHSRVRAAGSVVRDAAQPVGDCLAARAERVYPARVRVQERRRRRGAHRDRHPRRLVRHRSTPASPTSTRATSRASPPARSAAAPA